MSGWDYWKSISGSLEAASTQASKLAEVVSAQVSEQSRHIAAQASSYSAVAAQRATEYSKVAAENAASATSEARAQLAGLHLPEALANLHLPSGGSSVAVPDQAALERFCVTPDLCTFVRSMTYATFRDFPQEEADKVAEQGGSGTHPPLNPWQANHAKLVCMSVQEINELRFVLVPKVIDDAQFWAIYFALNRSRLPPECYDESLQVDEQPVMLDPPSRPPQLIKLAAAPEAIKKEFRDFKMKPAARESDDLEALNPEGSSAGNSNSGWLRNLLNGFDMEVPTGERLEQDTVLLGALHSRMHQLSEGARGIRLPDDLKQNIAANFNNVRDLLGLPHEATRQGMTSFHAAAPDHVGAAASPASTADGAGAAQQSASQGTSSAANSRTEAGKQSVAAVAEASDRAGNEDDRGSHVSVPLDTDPDLEAYLQEVEAPSAGGSASPAASEEGDFERYLEEFVTAGGNGSGGNGHADEVERTHSGRSNKSSGSSDGDDFEDLDEYLGGMASDDDKDDADGTDDIGNSSSHVAGNQAAS